MHELCKRAIAQLIKTCNSDQHARAVGGCACAAQAAHQYSGLLFSMFDMVTCARDARLLIQAFHIRARTLGPRVSGAGRGHPRRLRADPLLCFAVQQAWGHSLMV